MVNTPVSSRERLDQEGQLLPLGLHHGGLLCLMGAELLFLQQRSIEQDVGQRRLGLVGEVGEQRLDRRPFLRQIPGRSGGAVEPF